MIPIEGLEKPLPVIRPYDPRDEGAVIAAWERCGLTRPWNDPKADIARKTALQPDLLLVAEDVQGGIVGTAMAGYEGHRGWINTLAVLPEWRGGGLGRALMEAAADRLRAAGCPKINLQVRRANSGAIGFYRRLGYVEEDVVSLGMRLLDEG